MCSNTNDQYVVFADIINKITRTSGKVTPEFLPQRQKARAGVSGQHKSEPHRRVEYSFHFLTFFTRLTWKFFFEKEKIVMNIS